MKREFLQNFKVGDQALPKEIIDAIMEANGQDIEAAKKKGAEPFADYDHIKEQLATAQKALDGFKDVDVAQLQEQITQLQDDLKNKDKEWQAKLDDQAFDADLKAGISEAHGRDAAAVMAMLSSDTLANLKESKNRAADIKTALETLKHEKGYLFADPGTPPPMAPGAGGDPVLGGKKLSEMTYTEQVEYLAAHPEAANQ